MTQNESTWQAAAIANLQDAQTRRGRLGRPKSRNGCLTCKKRRVKCDEVRPACNRCQSTGRDCDGYTESSTSKSISPRSSVTSPGVPQSSLSLGLHDDEKRQLDFFVSRAAPRLAGPFDRDFWCGSVLQVAQYEPIIMDCLLTISTLYEHPQYVVSFKSKTEMRQGAFDLVKRSRSPVRDETISPVDANHRRALKFYNRAIRGFTQRMNEGTALPVLAMVSCVLFVCVETIRDHIHEAMSLYERGLDMLNQYSDSITSTSEIALLTHVRRMLLRVGVLAATFGHRAGALWKLDSSYFVLDNRFQTISEARLELFALLADSNTFTLDSNVWRDGLFEAGRWRADGSHHALFAERSPELNARFAELKKRHDQHAGELVRWRQAFEPLRQVSASTDAGSISYLLMIYYTFRVWLPTRLSYRKTAFDAHASEFRELVEQAEIYVNHNAGERPVFIFDMGAIPSLYWVASECRVPSIRRKALALLKKAPKKESILGADSSAEIADLLISIEERGLGLPNPGESDETTDMAGVDDSVLPAEDKRVHFMEVVKIGPVFEVQVTMLVEADGYFHYKVENVPI